MARLSETRASLKVNPALPSAAPVLKPSSVIAKKEEEIEEETET